MWQRELNRGHRMTAIGGSDNHDASKAVGERNAIGSPTTVVYAASLAERDVLAGIRAGHVFVDTEGVRGRLLEMTAVQGDQHAAMGDALAAPEGTTVRVAVHVSGVAGMRAVLVTDGVAAAVPGGELRAEETREVAYASDGKRHTLRVEVRDAAGALKLLGNPVYVN